MTTARRLLLVALLAASPLVLLGCTKNADGEGGGAGAGRAPAGPSGRMDRPYYPGTPKVQRDIRDLIASVPGATPQQWAAIAGKLVGYGEPAVPQMVASLRSSNADVGVMAAYALGVIQDPRSLEALHEAARGAEPKVRYEAATAMLRMGDRRGLAPLIAGLEDRDPLVRARAILVLRERTGEALGYRADDRPVDRAAAVARWRAWHAGTGGVMLPSGEAVAAGSSPGEARR